MKPTLLSIRNLSVHFPTTRGLVRAVENVSWSVEAGRTLAILGESGSGKSVSASAVMNLIDTPPAVIPNGEILFEGHDLLKTPQEERRRLNGRAMSMIFQDPLAALNPVYPIGWQIAETLRVHGVRKDVANRRAVELLDRVGIPDAARRAKDYPHQFSGGQRQRIMIASAIALEPKLLLADEPTSALDVTVQAQILDLLKSIKVETGMAMVVITHDLAVVEMAADTVVVMQSGKVVEQGPVENILRAPAQEYTRKLLDAVPGRGGFSVPHRVSSRCVTPLVEARDLCRTYGDSTTGVRAVYRANFRLDKGETLGVVGESGSGKSTLARMLLGLDRPTSGEILFDGRGLSGFSAREMYDFRKRVQFVFQDPTASLNPRMSVFQIISEPWAIHPGILERSEWPRRVGELLERVGLSPAHAGRYPHQFSGGQRQRIAIARSLTLRPELIICDEAVSALDVSVQAQVIALLKELRSDFDLSYIFVAHDLALIREFASSVLVMNKGEIVEQGEVDQVYERPTHAYTRQLLSATGAGLGDAA
ncbi:ABC transporter ATP-binding protein [Puniceibacterium sp. IMCC21224]|uniref:ABC transporter ATP-binding protein n=1 Tax=Puniceibacterium sp. IMCC21224 TaxID=1618204 RepID=UPI00064D9AEC|nr:ABC transporter ATP-binding protein [Puniceibacterium sp. IMCC21224]KMK69068.1 ATPase component of various ABC-type transport systems with duplicated ATPase domain [Puniceibacterium sp. IMCC21224]